MGAVAEEHRPRTGELGDNVLDLADRALLVDQMPGVGPVGHPATGVVDREDGVTGGTGFDHAVGFLERGRKRFLAEDTPGTGRDGGEA